MCAGIIQAVAEAMAFAKAEGLPLDKLIETLGKGAGSSWYFVNRAPNIVRGAYPGRLSRAAAREGPADLPRHGGAPRRASCRWSRRPSQQYRQLIEQGHGDEDISTIFRLKDALFAAKG